MILYTLGVDMGASGVKAALLDLDTFKISPVVTPSYDNGPQQSSDTPWEATASAIRDAVAGIDSRAILGASISGQMHGTVTNCVASQPRGLSEIYLNPEEGTGAHWSNTSNTTTIEERTKVQDRTYRSHHRKSALP